MSASIPAIIIGASGYVGGELLRLIAGHPNFELKAAVSDSAAGRPIGELFGHLATVYDGHTFDAKDGWLDRVAANGDLALFSAAPHGASAAVIATAIDACEKKGINVHVVDSSADFRFAEQDQWEAVYKAEHGAPSLLDKFVCAVPEHLTETDAAHIGHPGCFATASTLATVPLIQSGLTEAEVFISGVTGSTGSGKKPQVGTHHPERNSNFYAYKPLAHRHAPEVAALAEAASDRTTTVHFIPHSGPFARGIHVTLQAKANSPVSESELRKVYEDAYADSPFVQTDGDTVVAMAAIDNLVKGAAGGAMQWMNRLWGLPETAGLEMPAPGWT
jgi:N-acetyl-gamma-glutamyl-phosphate reductase